MSERIMQYVALNMVCPIEFAGLSDEFSGGSGDLALASALLESQREYLLSLERQHPTDVGSGGGGGGGCGGGGGGTAGDGAAGKDDTLHTQCTQPSHSSPLTTVDHRAHPAPRPISS